MYADHSRLSHDYSLGNLENAGIVGSAGFMQTPGGQDMSGVVVGLDGKLVPKTRFVCVFGVIWALFAPPWGKFFWTRHEGGGEKFWTCHLGGRKNLDFEFFGILRQNKGTRKSFA